MSRTPTPAKNHRPRIYDGEGDQLMSHLDASDKIILLPDNTSYKHPKLKPSIRIMWGQNLVEDVLDGKYRTLVCAVNATDNSRGIIAQIAKLLPTSQWTVESLTSYARQFVQPHTVSVIKFDMDMIEVLGLLRPSEHPTLSLSDIGAGLRIAAEMVARRNTRMPVASVSFLGAHANLLRDDHAKEPSFEAVLRTMYESGFHGDVYPTQWMWEAAPTGVFARYPFPPSLEKMREGGF